MQYLSPEFAFVFPLFFALYWLFGAAPVWQKRILLLASHLFYALFDWRFDVLLLLFSVGILSLARHASPKAGVQRRWPVWLGVVLAVLNLAVFKYYNFFREEVLQLVGGGVLTLPVLDILLPVGISFYTFQGIAYLLSVGRGERRPASWQDGLLYLSFFPTLLAGPICRPAQLLPQIESTIPKKLVGVDRAFLLILLAILKKVWIAAWLEQTWVKPIFANPDAYHAVELAGAVFAYAWQLYFDFSGYTDVVTAIALLLGYQLPVNFNQPYLATNLRDFWKRWHISLSSWIRDYVYIPLGGSRAVWWRAQVNVLLAMGLSGLWHGASFTFIAWGLWHGLGLLAQNGWEKISRGRWTLPALLAQGLTFLFVCAGWLLFRSDSGDIVLAFLNGLARWQTVPSGNWLWLYLVLAGFALLSPQAAKLMQKAEKGLARTPWWVKPAWLVSAVWFVMELAPAGMPGFIYFGF